MAVFALNPRVWVAMAVVFVLVLVLRVARGWIAELRRRWPSASSAPHSVKDP